MNLSKQHLVDIACAILVVLTIAFAAGAFVQQAVSDINNEQITCQQLGDSDG